MARPSSRLARVSEPMTTCPTFARWISAESCSSLGSTSAALLPPVLPGEPMPSACEWSGNRAETPELFVGADRLARVRREIEAHAGGVLLLTADVATAADWAASLSALGPVARLEVAVERSGHHPADADALAPGVVVEDVVALLAFLAEAEQLAGGLADLEFPRKSGHRVKGYPAGSIRSIPEAGRRSRSPTPAGCSARIRSRRRSAVRRTTRSRAGGACASS